MTTTAEQLARGFGAGVTPDPALEEIGTAATTHFKVARRSITDQTIRCTGKVDDHAHPGTHKVCGRLLAEFAARPWQIRCPRCKRLNRSPDEGDLSLSPPPADQAE